MVLQQYSLCINITCRQGYLILEHHRSHLALPALDTETVTHDHVTDLQDAIKSKISGWSLQ